MTVRRLRIAACAMALALVVSACGSSGGAKASAHHAGGQLSGVEVADANNNGGYVQAGAITYQLQISRELNPYSTEDSQYVKGLPPGYAQPTAMQLWYGVFLWAKNQHGRPYTTTDRFEIEDTQGDLYHPIRLSSALNPFAWKAQTLGYGQTEPGVGTIASNGPTQGGLLLFKLNDSVYNNRPLTLYILGAQGQREASISLDL